MSMVKAWLPYILVVIFLLGTSKLVPPINQFLGQFKSSFVIYCGEGGAKVGLSWINTPGILMIIATIIGTAVQGASISDMGAELGKTFKGYWKAMLTVIFIISIAKVMGYAGMVMDLASSDWWYRMLRYRFCYISQCYVRNITAVRCTAVRYQRNLVNGCQWCRCYSW